MLTKGTPDVKWSESDEPYKGVDKKLPDGEKHWYEKVMFNDLGIPFCERAPSSKRIYFSVYPRLEWKALEIKEASFGKFKTVPDVHRNAHYIGMYVLEQMFIRDKKDSIEERVFKKMKEPKKLIHQQETMRGFFEEFYESFAKGGISREELQDHAIAISDEITDPKLKEWFISYCDSVMESKESLRKIKDRLRKRDVGSSKLSLVQTL